MVLEDQIKLYQLQLIAQRAEQLKRLAEAYSRGDYLTSGGEVNDFAFLEELQEDWDVEIPPDLIAEARCILTETSSLNLGPGKCPSAEQREQNQKRYVEYFTRCAGAERELYDLLSGSKSY